MLESQLLRRYPLGRGLSDVRGMLVMVVVLRLRQLFDACHKILKLEVATTRTWGYSDHSAYIGLVGGLQLKPCTRTRF